MGPDEGLIIIMKRREERGWRSRRKIDHHYGTERGKRMENANDGLVGDGLGRWSHEESSE